MNKTDNSGVRQGSWPKIVLALIFGLLIGLLAGLYVGWYAWPVEWVGGAADSLSPQAQEDILRSHIASYAFDQDQLQAFTRYSSLGERKSFLLNKIWNDPAPLTTEDVEKFAAAVGASAALGAEPSPVDVPAQAAGSDWLASNPLVIALVSCIGLLLLAMLGVAVISQRKPAKPSPGIPPANTHETDLEVDRAPSMMASSEGEAPALVEDQLPDWLQQAQPNPFDTALLDEDETAESTIQSEDDLAATPPYGIPLSEIETEIEELDQSDIDLIDADISSPLYPDTTELHRAVEAVFMDEEIFSDVQADEGLVQAPDELQVAATSMDDFSWLDEAATVEEITEGVELPALDQIIETEESTEEIFAKFSADISLLAGIEPDAAEKLRSAGISVLLLLFRRGSTAEGRNQIASETGLDADQILQWVNFVDLFRIKGINQDYDDLLHAAGIVNMDQLAQSDPTELYRALEQTSSQVPYLNRFPSRKQVEEWVEEARNLPPSVT